MGARLLASQERALLQDAVAPDLWSAANDHSSHGGSGGGSDPGGWGGGAAGPLAAAPAPGPAASAANGTGDPSADALSPYMATPDTVVIVLGVAAIMMTLAAIGLRLYRSEHGCCCRSTPVQPTAGPAAGQAPQRAAKPAQLQAPPVIVVMPNEELLCAVKDGTPHPVPRTKPEADAAGEEFTVPGNGRLVLGMQQERRRPRPRDTGHVPAWWVFDALNWGAPRLLLPAAPRPGMQRAQAVAAKGDNSSFCYII
ncbi:hypothetical protein COHA_009704 [Chlorella ohadii]|uniref:Uncharacterized protein n=1 Tax=Chlorella ohadii TaxID=2649997 RepID=A0AAD5GXL9_9CHLO|nr:hypothetical protein COHA_009704 [Chlorella ohadii]